MLFENFIFLGDFQSNAQNTLKSFLFEIAGAPSKSAQLLKTILVLETKCHKSFKSDIRFWLNIKNTLKCTRTKKLFSAFLCHVHRIFLKMELEA